MRRFRRVRAQARPVLFGDNFEQDAPVALYTDIVSGPISGGENDEGIANGGNGSDSIDDVRIHHHRIRRVTQFGINIAVGSRDWIDVWDKW